VDPNLIFNKLKESVVFRRSVAFFFHLAGTVLAYAGALLLRFDFDAETALAYAKPFPWQVVTGFFAAIIAMGLYRGIWRFFTLRDCFTTARAIAIGTGLAAFLVLISNQFTFQDFPRSIIPVTALLLMAWELGIRGMLRLIREHRYRRGEGETGAVLLVGNPEEADALLRNLVRYPGRVGRVAGLVSHANRHGGQQLRGVPIHGVDNADVPGLIKKQEIGTVLFLPPLNTPAFIRDTMGAIGAAGLKCDYRIIPSMSDVAAGRVGFEQMRRVSIEDLLHRPPHQIDLALVRSSIAGKKVMVTGAGGSIGSEICRQVLALQPACLVLFESSEFGLFEIERELGGRNLTQRRGDAETQERGDKEKEARSESRKPILIVAVAGDVRRAEQVGAAIETAGGIDVIFHAAAYKHVHLMERNPVACFQNNVIGTLTVAAVAEERGVGDFVLISTDKAVRPTSLMGASKRLAERGIIERPRGATRFKAVRFGNVLGSSGSVIPIFRKQISEGGPVTVTSKQVTRYFMTIPEAVELVIAAGAVSDDRTICVLEMGEPVKIDSLARRMIELSGFVPDVDIPIIYTGLKPGEKEYEELLTDDEGVTKTEHDRIWVVEKSSEVDAPPLNLGELLELLDAGDAEALREYAHRNIPGSLLVGQGLNRLSRRDAETQREEK